MGDDKFKDLNKIENQWRSKAITKLDGLRLKIPTSEDLLNKNFGEIANKFAEYHPTVTAADTNPGDAPIEQKMFFQQIDDASKRLKDRKKAGMGHKLYDMSKVDTTVAFRGEMKIQENI